MKLLLASQNLMSGRIHISNYHPQDRSIDPSKSLGPSRAIKYAFQYLGVFREPYGKIICRFGEISGAISTIIY